MAEVWINSRLSNDPELVSLVGGRIYPDVVPEGTAVPYVEFFKMAEGGKTENINAVRVSTTMVYLVRGVTQTNDLLDLAQIAGRIDDLLNFKSGAIPGLPNCFVTQSIQSMSHSMPLIKDGKEYRALGAQYEIDVQQRTA